MSVRSMYRTINTDHFPPSMEITFRDGEKRQTLVYEKATWTIDGEVRGLRYGENPNQQAALYRLVNGNLVIGDVQCIEPGRYLASDVELLQSGKHPGKINITDVDSALNILRYLSDSPACVVVKHNNPSGAATGESLAESYSKAYMADRVAAFGGAVALNREVDRLTAEQIAASYSEVVVAPEYAEGTVEILAGRKNLRIMRIGSMSALEQFVGTRVVDFKSLIDGAVVAQWSQVPVTTTADAFVPAETTYKGDTYRITREPTESERIDMRFGWLVEFGVTSNSVIYVKDGVTVGIGTGEQDRVGVAEIARDKAYLKHADRLAWETHGEAYRELDESRRSEVWRQTENDRGGLIGSAMISDAFFPFTDGVQVGIDEGVTAIVQPGGALRDHEVIEACNAAGTTMVFTGQRAFRH
jgi:phosphoribosylaminoimidazolecarboxamide formyltransferase / IMP cyclohydrolase